MKKEQTQLFKYKNKLAVNEIYYSHPSWGEKEIDGVKFLPVLTEQPTGNMRNTVYWMRKDSLEKVK